MDSGKPADGPPLHVESVLRRLNQKKSDTIQKIMQNIDAGGAAAASDMEELERLGKLSAVIKKFRQPATRIINLIVFVVMGLVLIVLFLVRLPHTSVDLELRATDLRFDMNERSSVAVIPGESGQILALKRALLSGIETAESEIAITGGYLDLKSEVAGNGIQGAGPAPPVNLYAITIPADAPVSVGASIAYSENSRGIILTTHGEMPVEATLGRPISVQTSADQTTDAFEPIKIAAMPQFQLLDSLDVSRTFGDYAAAAAYWRMFGGNMKYYFLSMTAAALISQQVSAATPAAKQLQADAQKFAAELRAAGEPKDRCGLGFIIADHGVVLRNTSGGTDIIPGDQIETIDSVSVANLPVQQIINILRSKAPTASLALSVNRNGASRQVMFTCINARTYNAPLLTALDAAAKGDFKGCLSNLNGREDLGEAYWLFRMRCSAANGKLDPATDAQLLYDWLNAAIEDARFVDGRRAELLDVLHKSEAGFRAANRSELHDRLVALSKQWPGSSSEAYASRTPDWAQFRATAEASVRARLVDPASAQFEWPYGFMYGTWKPLLQKRIEGYFTCGLVNARNRMGGYTGSSSFAVVMADATTVKWVEISSGRDFDFTDAACAKTAKSLPPAPLQMRMAGPISQPTSIADELEKLASLRDKGIITQAEFDAQKAKLLAK